MSAPSRQAYSVVVVAVVVGVVAAVGFTGVISASQFTQPNYDPQTPDVSFVSFCAEGDGGPTADDITVSFETLTYNGETKDWQVSYTTSDDVTVDYLILKGGNLDRSPNAYLLKVDDPVSPVSVFGGQDDGTYTTVEAEFPSGFDATNTCLAGDSGTKFENEL
jgi:hypothetical protein